ncbi:MAG TPA: PilZ domain-containing protein [Chthoniobacteraceae bacterium]|jgi:hypothetical protein|nr:hypothetical protein [Chthoniobacter sp.]HEV7868522.1 PilZ domain-containing protein [Chthoniobacteraceae bacterium]
MYSRELESVPEGSFPSIYLDYGADADSLVQGALEISERGMRFESRWQFSIGTQLAVSLQHMHPRLGLCRMTIEGIVVWCEPHTEGRFENTLLFLELPDELRSSLREFSYLVAPAE